MSMPRAPGGPRRPRPPANDNTRQANPLGAEVLIPADTPITDGEIEVLAALLDDWDMSFANDNERMSQ